MALDAEKLIGQDARVKRGVAGICYLEEVDNGVAFNAAILNRAEPGAGSVLNFEDDLF